MTTDALQLSAALNTHCACAAADLSQLQRRIGARIQSVETPAFDRTHPHLFSSLPYFITRVDVQRMQSIIAAIERVVGMAQYREFVLSRAPPIARHDQGTKSVFFGYDFHLTPGGPKLIEINTNAGGALLNVRLLEVQLECCGAAPLLSAYGDLSVPEHKLFEMFLREWELSGRAEPLRSIAIVDEAPEKQYLFPEFLLFKRLFEEHGLSVSIADPRDLKFDGHELSHAGKRIDLVYNRLTDFYFERPEHATLRAAYLADAAVVTPHPRAHALYADKRNLVTLSDAGVLRDLGADSKTIETLIQGIPRTRVVTRSDASQWWTDRDEWFFKPSGGFGSRGAYRGDKLTKRVFETILDHGYVAQRVAYPSERHAGGGSKLKADVRNYVYDGAVQLIATRLYQGQTTNFRTQGGGFSPVFLIGDDALQFDSAEGCATRCSRAEALAEEENAR